MLVLILLYNNVLYYLVFKVRKSIIQYEVRKANYLNDPNITLIKYSLDDPKEPLIQWVEKDEFLCNDIMYDLLESKKAGDTIYLFCKRDLKEDNLLSELAKHIRDLTQQNDKQQDHQAESLWKMIQKINYCQESSSLFKHIYLSTLKVTEPYTFLYLSICQEIIAPPPQVAFLQA